MRLGRSLLVPGILALLASPALASEWKIDPYHSFAHFKVKHLLITNVQGEMSGVEGTIDINDQDISKSKVIATVDAKTINTGNGDRDKHLRSPDFFNVEKCPTIKFVSTKVSGTPGSLKVEGDLTMNCKTKSVVLDVDGPTQAIKGMKGEMRRGLAASTKINRQDFGISWNKSLDGGGVVVADEVTISIDVESIAAAH